ncbi:MAG TPA: hypothetical protein DEP72_00090 [Clostridiales bacterium]|nr:MAG: hypothetical protein A2Y18_08370 [Clostridiales bacterium GWD2_32_19]HCC06551.1 hypothetical protein [Clostridiales bacterium]
MSYVEILIITVVLAIIVIPITMSITGNAYTVAENVGLERAVVMAQKEISSELIGLASAPVGDYEVVAYTVGDYTITKNVLRSENYVKVTVTWKVAGESKQYVLYETIPVTDYNS